MTSYHPAAGDGWSQRKLAKSRVKRIDEHQLKAAVGRYRQFLAVLLFLALLLAIAEFSGLREHFNLPYLREMLVNNRLGGLAIFVFLFSFANLIQIPGALFLVAAILALGQTWGGIVTYVAALTSCAVTYLVVHYLGADALRQFNNRTAARILAHLDAHPIRSVVLLRLMFQTLPAANYALALSGIGMRNYMIGSLLGLPIPIALFCVFFDFLVIHVLHL